MDTLLQFNITYFDHSEQHVINSRKRIAKHFTKSWLLYDLVAIVPYDLIVWMITHKSSRGCEWLALLYVGEQGQRTSHPALALPGMQAQACTPPHSGR